MAGACGGYSEAHACVIGRRTQHRGSLSSAEPQTGNIAGAGCQPCAAELGHPWAVRRRSTVAIDDHQAHEPNAPDQQKPSSLRLRARSPCPSLAFDAGRHSHCSQIHSERHQAAWLGGPQLLVGPYVVGPGGSARCGRSPHRLWYGMAGGPGRATSRRSNLHR